MHWDQIIGVIVTLVGAGGLGAFIASLRSSGSAVKAADLERMAKIVDEMREENGRISGRVLVLEDQYRKLWDQHVVLQQSHATLQAEHIALQAERARWRVREGELEAEVGGLKARVAELERAATAPGTGGGS